MEVFSNKIVLREGGREYTFDIDELYHESITRQSWINPYTGAPLPPAFIESVVSQCCPKIYVSYVTNTHNIKRDATIGRVIVDFLLETISSIDDDVVNLDNHTNTTSSLFRYSITSPIYSTGIEHFMLTRGRFSSDLDKMNANRQLLNYLMQLPTLTVEESELYYELESRIKVPAYVPTYYLEPETVYVPYQVEPGGEYETAYNVIESPVVEPQVRFASPLVQPAPVVETPITQPPARRPVASRSSSRPVRQDVIPAVQQPAVRTAPAPAIPQPTVQTRRPTVPVATQRPVVPVAAQRPVVPVATQRPQTRTQQPITGILRQPRPAPIVAENVTQLPDTVERNVTKQRHIIEDVHEDEVIRTPTENTVDYVDLNTIPPVDEYYTEPTYVETDYVEPAPAIPINTPAQPRLPVKRRGQF